ncbi:MAG: tRNA 2-thiouridine(34) synthase MnmA, partial [bacterium]|nr:tRNA 2-thiouridine(34) synthase MnmA [bacterium]
TMIMGLKGEEERIEKIKHLSEVLGVPHSVIDIREVFKKKVVDYFLDSYAAGITPNPCVACNNAIKFNLLMKEALVTQKADYYATGHYAEKIEIDGKYFLTEPEDRTKSQIYFLSMIGNEALKKVLFPISGISITKVREIVKDLPLANKAESQDVCFLHDDKLIDYLKEHLPAKYFKEGDILDINGTKIGRHKGAVYFTIGQRRGTGFASDRKLYVVAKSTRDNTITLGDEKDLYSDSVAIEAPVYWREIKEGDEFKCKFRYMSSFHRGVVSEASEKTLKAVFKKPVLSITSGQVGVFYDNDIIVAGGFIK